jgi:hypothetical protein
VLVRSIWLQDFLSFNASAALRLNKGLSVITGPNGAGKSNLARSLDVVRAVLAPHDHPESERLDLYREAGFEGATEFTVKLDMVLDQPWEHDLVRTHVQAVHLTSEPGRSEQAADSFEGSVDWLVADSLAPLMAGTLVVRYRATAVRPWAAYWEFSDEDSGATWHAVLVDDQGVDQLRPGEARGRGGQPAGRVCRLADAGQAARCRRAGLQGRHADREGAASRLRGGVKPGRPDPGKRP